MKISSGVQQRLDYLLEKSKESRLASEEQEELEKILLVSDLMNLAKAKAQRDIRKNTENDRTNHL